MKVTTAFFLSLVIASSAAVAQPKAEPLPTMQELQALFERQEWQPLLQKSSRVLALRNSAAVQGYDRYEILMMRGEAQLNLKASPAAVAAFKDALDETKDPEKVAIARATMSLVKKSSAGQFTRKSPTTQPSDPRTFDIVDRSKRKAAFVAMVDDELLAVEPKAKAAEKGTSLKPIADMFQSVEDVRTAELAGTGKTDRTDALVGPLAKRATDLSNDELKRQTARVDKVDRSANQIIDYDTSPRNRGYDKNAPRFQEKRYKKQGLLNTDARDLKDAIETCKKIGAADGQLAEAFGEKLGKPLIDVADGAKTLSERAEKILNADYSHTSSDPSGLK